MEFNNKTILITGLIICSVVAMYLNYEQIALAIVSGLVGYLSKDIIDTTSTGDSTVSSVNSIISDGTISSVNSDDQSEDDDI